MAISGWMLIILLVLSSLFIIVNTIRLTVIEGMKKSVS